MGLSPRGQITGRTSPGLECKEKGLESKLWHKGKYLQNKNRLTDIETCGCQVGGPGGGGGERDGLGVRGKKKKNRRA